MIRIRVPATSANLGPGFDCLGIALGLYNQFDVELSETLVLHGCAPAYAGPDNLFVRACRLGFETAGVLFPEISVRFTSDIPVARGLGSSATCIVAGLLAASVLLAARPVSPDSIGSYSTRLASPSANPGSLIDANPGIDRRDSAFLNNDRPSPSLNNNRPGRPIPILDRQTILDLAARMEGHPDNVTPALLGGFAVSILEDGTVRSIRSPIGTGISFNVLIPDFELETSVARAALPSTLAFKDAVFNSGRAALTAAAFLTRDWTTLGFACADRLHERYRAPLIPNFDAIVSHSKASGALTAFLSGAGPAIMAITTNSSHDDSKTTASRTTANTFAAAMLPFLASLPGPSWKLLTLSVDDTGATVELFPDSTCH